MGALSSDATSLLCSLLLSDHELMTSCPSNVATQEIQSAVRFLGAVIIMPIGDGVALIDDSGETLTIDNITRPKKLGLVVLQLVRLGLCGVLTFTGVRYLVGTIALSDLILNMLALEFVLNLDELVFACLAPLNFKTMIPKVVPLKTRTARSCSGIDLSALVTLLATGLAVVLVAVFMTLPQQGLFKQGRDVLCAGELDFVYSKNGLGQFGWTETAKPAQPPGNTTTAVAWDQVPWPVGVVQTSIPHTRRALLGVLTRNTDCKYCYQGYTYTPGETPPGLAARLDDCCLSKQAHFPSVAAGRFSIASMAIETGTMATAVGNANCKDTLRPPAIRSVETSYTDDNGAGDGVNIFRAIVADHVLDESCEGCPPQLPLCYEGQCTVPECWHVLELGLCTKDDESGMRARQYCPVTCGCVNPVASLPLSQDFNGCPTECAQLPEHNEIMERVARNCSDLDHTSGHFRDYIKAVLDIGKEWPQSLKLLVDAVYGLLMAYGCDAVPAILSGEWVKYPQLCTSGGPLVVKDVSFFCPASCGCMTPGACDFQCLP